MLRYHVIGRIDGRKDMKAAVGKPIPSFLDARDISSIIAGRTTTTPVIYPRKGIAKITLPIIFPVSNVSPALVGLTSALIV